MVWWRVLLDNLPLNSQDTWMMTKTTWRLNATPLLTALLCLGSVSAIA